MPLMSFSESAHVPLLLDGRKQQTTRLQRAAPFKPGEILYCYFRSRMRPSCRNCIGYDMDDVDCVRGYSENKKICDYWHNYFGEAEVLHARPLALYHGNMEKWAIADGFDSLSAAANWFAKTYNKSIAELVRYPYNLEVISFDPRWL